MAKFCGIIGYTIQEEDPPESGIWVNKIVTRRHYGDLLRNSIVTQSTDQVNDEIKLSNEISIVADPFAFQNFQFMIYVEFMGAKWKITNVKVSYPRLILTIGGVYNGQ